MNCDQSRVLIDGWIDQEIPEDDRAALESHLATCPDCRELADAVRVTDADLMAAFQPGREAAQRVSQEVARSLRTHSSDRPRATSAAATGPSEAAPSSTNWLSLALALVIGFVLALVIFPPASQQIPESPEQIARPAHPPEFQEPGSVVPRSSDPPQVATLVAYTGDVQFDFGTGNWTSSTETEMGCPSDSRVRTSKNSLCELVTADGAIVRMDVDTEVRLRSARELELQRGQLFCRSPEGVPIAVTSCDATEPPSVPPETLWSATGAGTEFIASKASGGSGCVTPSKANVAVETSSGRHQIQPGESAIIVNGRVDRTRHDNDPLLSASWIHPLLTRKGHRDPELRQRVDELLAQIGRSKTSTLYESELRSLGEYCVLPLIRYVQSPISRKEPNRRTLAIRVVADLVPAVALGELLPLLSDESPEVRFQTARALQRLTGLTHGRSPEQWRVSLTNCAPTSALWTAWWEGNRDRLPALPAMPTD